MGNETGNETKIKAESANRIGLFRYFIIPR